MSFWTVPGPEESIKRHGVGGAGYKYLSDLPFDPRRAGDKGISAGLGCVVLRYYETKGCAEIQRKCFGQCQS